MACCKRKDAFDCCKKDHLVCVCMGLMQSDICDAIEQGADTFQALQDMLEVGTGCSSCVAQVHDLLRCKKNLKDY